MELAYVLKGTATHVWDKNTSEITAGDYFVIDYRSQHSYHAKTKEFEMLNCLFLPEFIDPAFANCTSFNTLLSSYQLHFNNKLFLTNPSMSIYKDSDGKIKQLLLSLIDEFTNKSSGYIQIIRSRLIEIIILTVRKIYFSPDINKGTSSIDSILEYINQNYMNDISLKEIGRTFNYSTSYISMKFKKEFHISFSEYLQKVRIEHSMHLLAHTDLSINDIAEMSGYSDLKFFYAIFKKITNTTPAKFRKNY